tara:strand:+ start:131 stop:619 length:489 start_codon:yes stop_codon:yes gene_type:complete
MSNQPIDDGGGWTVVPKKNKKRKKPKNPNAWLETDDNNQPDSDVTILRKRPDKNVNKTKQPRKYINKQKQHDGRKLHKVANDSDNYKSKSLRNNVKQAIVKARNGKKMKRNQLASMLNVKPNIIAEYETGNPIPDNNLLGKMERVLGIKLRGGDDQIGRPNK